ncbi:MAG: PilZ domain-containing protein [Deltaproteobacteria bacterium]|nr:PilZ domain-containing protein [Deltaproteobacteria bacterium]
MADQRLYQRVPVLLRVRYRDGNELASSYVQNISGGGVFVRTFRPLPVGLELTLELYLEDGSEEPMTIKGKVVWERLIGRDDGMGIQFLEPVPERLKKILTEKGS